MRAVELLHRVEADEVTWDSDVAGRVSWRLWITERAYLICTPMAKRLETKGLVKRYTAYMHGRGGVELTEAGKAALEPAKGP